MYSVYFLVSVRFRKTYTGITKDINKRLKQHNAGQTVFTNRFRPWKLLHTETFKTRAEARKREKILKVSCWP